MAVIKLVTPDMPAVQSSEAVVGVGDQKPAVLLWLSALSAVVLVLGLLLMAWNNYQRNRPQVYQLSLIHI